MTNEEAIEKLKNDCEATNLECDCKGDGCADCYIRCAIESLEKQIPKKPILKERTSIVHLNKGNQPHEWKCCNYNDWCCPICDSGVGEQYIPREHNQRKLKYCSKCGQHIDWD